MEWLQAACLSMGIWACGGDTSDAAHTEYYQKYLNISVAELVLPNLAGDAVKLSKFKGKPVVLNIWATWCPPCIKEMPSLATMAKESEFHVIAISVDARKSNIDKFLAKSKRDLSNITFLHDSIGRKSRHLLGFHEYPVTYLLTPELKTKAIFTGPRKWESPQMLSKLRAYLIE